MAFVTVAQAVAASRAVWSSRSVAESHLTKSAAVPMNSSFDIFMSHSYEDAEVIAGIKVMIEHEGLSVYVDWLVDVQADRSQVTAETAGLLRQRMNHCLFFIYASSDASPNSKWMPWELGYFDGLRPGKIGILPVVESTGDAFNGQEYLGLYPPYELLSFSEFGQRLGRRTGARQGEMLKADVRRLW
jgi:hypothetical protein